MSKPGEQEVPETSEISPVLFLDASGHSMRFYVRPGLTKTQLHPLITNGGGVLCRNQEPGAILLVDPCDVNSAMASAGQTFISAKFISDCAEQNQQLDLNDYVISVGPSVRTRMAARHQGNGRLCYSLEDDEAILRFIEKRQHEAKGNLVWREMAKRNVTDHSWQSMKDRFLKHLKHKLTEKSLKKSPSKRKALSFTQSPLSKRKVTQPETEPDTLRKSIADSSETQIATENDSCPMVRTSSPHSPERASSSRSPQRASSSRSPQRASSSRSPQRASSSRSPQRDSSSRSPQRDSSSRSPQRDSSSRSPERDSSSRSPERDSSPPDVPEAASEPPHASSHDRLDPDQEQEPPDPEVSKSPRLDKDGDGRDIPDGSNEHSSLNKTKQTTCKTSTDKKLGILAKAAREFEDSDVMDESEGEDPCEVPILEPSDAQESSASSATLAREPESQAERHEEARQDSPAPEEEQRPHPSTAVSNAHAFMFDSESQEQNPSQARAAPGEPPSRILEDVKEHVKNLMRETKKDLVEVTKALLKASGDFTNARVFLVDGYEPEVHGPLWDHLDDEILLLDDPYELEQLQAKFGEEQVTRRRIFLTADKN